MVKTQYFSAFFAILGDKKRGFDGKKEKCIALAHVVC